jgi:hypothetical protein
MDVDSPQESAGRISGNNGGAGRLEAECVAVGPSYGRGWGRFRKKLFVLFETIFGTVRVPGAMQRFFNAASQNRTPVSS